MGGGTSEMDNYRILPRRHPRLIVGTYNSNFPSNRTIFATPPSLIFFLCIQPLCIALIAHPISKVFLKKKSNNIHYLRVKPM